MDDPSEKSAPEEGLGCEICRNGWFSGELPRRVGLSKAGAVIVFQCDNCGTYWFQTERYAAPVSVEEARRTAPDVMQDSSTPSGLTSSESESSAPRPTETAVERLGDGGRRLAARSAAPAVSLEQARTAARALLSELSAATGRQHRFFAGEWDVPEYEEYGDVWVFNWNSGAYFASWDFRDQVLAGPIAVPKDGSAPFLLGTSGTTDEELGRWREATNR